MIDVGHRINSVRRTVGARVLEAGEARLTTISQVYDGDLADVWDACTNPDRIPRWFLPVSGDLRVGGRYQLEGTAGGTIEECDPPHRFNATWEFGGAVTWIEVRLRAESGDRTRFELEHIAIAGDETWAQFGPGAVGIGWDLGLTGLALHLDSGEAVDPDVFARWSTSEDGRRFVTLSSEQWYDAAVAAGEDPAVARGAADRTTAAYIAPPES